MFDNESSSDDQTETVIKPQRHFKVILFNDEDHTYQYVVEMLTASAELSADAAFRCAVEVDVSGKTIVYYGTHSDSMDVMNKIVNYGPDHRLPHSASSMDAEVQKI
jgi:ATP-dependent Clp protease adaptor protein ClpS